MGYACPVCGAEQADGVHLANHLAVTASLGRPEHEEWLADYAPDWGQCTPEELAERVVEHALEIETPDFEGGGHEPAPDFESALAAQGRQPGRGAATAEVDAVLEEARELTERMYRDGADGDEHDERDRREEDGESREGDGENREGGGDDRGETAEGDERDDAGGEENG